MAKIPHFPFYPDDWIASRKRIKMSYARQGIYMLLLAHAWNDPDCSIPSDIESLQILCPKAKADDILFVTHSCFEPGGEGLVNPKLRSIRQKANDITEKASYAGKCSANKRTKSTDVEHPLNDRSTNQNHNQNHNHNQKKKKEPSVPKKTGTDPRVAEVIKYFYEQCEAGITGTSFKPAINGQDGQRVKEALKFMPVEDIMRCIDFFLPSKKAKDIGITLSIALSAHTINLYRQGGGNGSRFEQICKEFGIPVERGPEEVHPGGDRAHGGDHRQETSHQGRNAVLDLTAIEVSKVEN